MKAQRDIYEEGRPKTKDTREQKQLSTLEPISEPSAGTVILDGQKPSRFGIKEVSCQTSGKKQRILAGRSNPPPKLATKGEGTKQERESNIRAACLGDPMSCPHASSQQLLLSATSEKRGQLP